MIEQILSDAGTAFTKDEPIETQASQTGEAFVLLAIRSESPRWLDSHLQYLERLSDLKENWDSYGARPIRPESIRIAKEVLENLARIDSVEAPTVTASPDGLVALCWDDGTRSMDLEVHDDGSFEYAYMNELYPSFDEDGVTFDLKQIAFLLTRF